MELFRLYAYSVIQQKGAGEAFVPPSGGTVDIVPEVTTVLDKALADAERAKPTKVQLRMDPAMDRSSFVLEAVQALAGADEVAAGKGALRLAERLNRVMDMRSKAGLLIAATRRPSESDELREVALWVFPRDSVLRFRSTQHRIDVVEDVFNQTSRQRKLALFSGRGLRGEFRAGRVLDFQAREPGKRVAAFWMEHFLEADPDLSDEQGSRMLADLFVRTSKKLTDPGDRDQLQAAVIALRHAPPSSRSFASVADEFLEGTAKSVFEAEAEAVLPDVDARHAQFRLERETFAQYVNYRFFRLGAGTQVVVPVDEIGRTVQVDAPTTAVRDPEQRQMLRLEDTIVEDKMTRRRG